MPDEKELSAALLPPTAADHSDLPAVDTISPNASSVDSPMHLTQSQPAHLPSYRLPSSAALAPTASYTVYQPPTIFHTSHPRPPPLLLIPATPSSNPSSSSSIQQPLSAVPMALDTILVRAPHRFSWSSFSNQYLWPLQVPSFASPHIASYVSRDEWTASMQRLNSALRWPSPVQVARLVLFVTAVVSFCAIWSHEVREKKTFTVACWAAMIVAGIAFVVLTKVYGGRARRALEAAVDAESAYYEGRAGPGRENRLPCCWRMDEQFLVVSAPTVGPAFLGSLTLSAQTGRRDSQHDYVHESTYSARNKTVHTPMAHY